MNQADILAIGAHPDDVEIGMGGTIAKYSDQGFLTVIVNLTKAELSSNGTVELRQREAEEAAKILRAKRLQFSFPDRDLLSHRKEGIETLVKLIRQYRPKIVFAPFSEDRHPDHGHCGEIVKEAVFSAGIRRYLPDCEWEAYRPEALYYYQINGVMKPQFVVDISGFIDEKLAALSCYKSQFESKIGGTKTPLNSGYLEAVKARERVLGHEMGVLFAEGFVPERPMLISNLLGE